MLERYEDVLFALEKACRTWLLTIVPRGRVTILLLALLTFGAYLPSLLILPAVDRTEPMVAVASRGLLTAGEILRPSYQGQLQTIRPAGRFWVQALTVAVAEIRAQNSIVTNRLPSLIATTLAVIVMFLMLRQLIGVLAAFIASLLVAVTPIIALHAHLAIAEPLTLPALIGAQLLLMRLYGGPSESGWPQRRLAVVFWVILGVSTWFNALAAPLLSLVTIITLAAWDRNLELNRRLEPWFGEPLMVVIALPWLIALSAMSGGVPLAEFSFWRILDILEGGQDMKLEVVPGACILTLALGFVPLAYILSPLLQAQWSQRQDSVIRFAFVWLLAPIVALELLSN